jgi:hypothetical protein
LSTFGVGGHELSVSTTQYFKVFREFPFVFNVFARFAGVVAAVEIIVLTVKTSPWPAETTHAPVEKVLATDAGTPAATKTTHATVTTTHATVKEVVTAFPTSQRIIEITQRAAKIISPTINAVQ